MRGWTIAAPAALMMAAAPPGTDTTSPVHQWFEEQRSMSGFSCCGEGDGHILSDDDWRAAGDHYEVFVEGQWRRVERRSDLEPGHGPNPTGHAVVWYRGYPDVWIFCFTPGTTY